MAGGGNRYPEGSLFMDCQGSELKDHETHQHMWHWSTNTSGIGPATHVALVHQHMWHWPSNSSVIGPTTRVSLAHQYMYHWDWRWPSGRVFAGLIWRGLALLVNRLRTGVGRAKTVMRRWGYLDPVGGLRLRGATYDGPPPLLPSTRRGLHG